MLACLAVWKAKRTSEEPIRLVWVHGKVRRATRGVWKTKTTPDEPKRLVWLCGEARRVTTMLSKWGSRCYGVDRRCGVAEVKGVAELLGYGVEWRSGVGGVRS